MSYKLNKPFTETERKKFIKKHSGMDFAECPEYLCALEEWETLVGSEIEGDRETWEKETRRNEILERLNEIDLKSIRALRANDTEYITAYETEAVELREELRELED